MIIEINRLRISEGLKLKGEIRGKKMTKTQLASAVFGEDASVHRSVISKLDKGDRTLVRIDLIKKIAKTLGVSQSFLIDAKK